jgi:methylated-DNA-[protein]-cysteine S-methyltransferase
MDVNKQRSFAFFETAIGRCAIAWGEHGIAAATLPATSDRHAVSRLHRLVPGAGVGSPPPPVREAIEGIRALFAGEARDLSTIALEMGRLPAFDRHVYEVARTIACGETRTYGEIAATIGPGADPRQVGRALARNPFPPIVPCHRVVAANGRPGGFSAPGGVLTKLRLLAIEARHGAGPLTLFEAA